MNKRKSSKILKNQIKKLSTISESEHQLWKGQTRTYIIEFFSKESSEYSYINHFRFKDINARPIGDNSHKSTDQLKIEMETFLNNCIETINNVGLSQHNKQSFLSKIPVPIIVLIISSIGYLIFYLGTIKTKYDHNKLNIEIENLKDSISIISTNIISNKTKDSTNNPSN